jgi:hypothetical protein
LIIILAGGASSSSAATAAAAAAAAIPAPTYSAADMARVAEGRAMLDRVRAVAASEREMMDAATVSSTKLFELI